MSFKVPGFEQVEFGQERVSGIVRQTVRIHPPGHAVQQTEKYRKNRVRRVYVDQFAVQGVAEVFQQAKTLFQVERKDRWCIQPGGFETAGNIHERRGIFLFRRGIHQNDRAQAVVEPEVAPETGIARYRLQSEFIPSQLVRRPGSGGCLPGVSRCLHTRLVQCH